MVNGSSWELRRKWRQVFSKKVIGTRCVVLKNVYRKKSQLIDGVS